MTHHAVDGTRSQTLHRGLILLALVAEASAPPTLPDLAHSIGLHRSVVYRLLRTLEDHRLVERTADDRYLAGLGLLVLGRGIAGDLRTAAASVLPSLADDLTMTAFVVVRDHDEVVTLLSVEPVASNAHVTYRPGSRHRVDLGAPGLALQAAGPAQPDERTEVTVARRQGWAATHGEVLPGLSAVAAPVVTPGGAAAAVCVVFAGSPDPEPLASRVMAAASDVATRLR
ncbi:MULTISPECIES: IclR family transcriptional regulator [unclassified Frankia]|uniref:IclR family transcriptional regulator n=1 Tax=unclassified Frankia TaxID=2632575 RepID=UPI002AD4E32B|nr:MULTISPECIES: helix-turn-helix domain-containing protein [unclassified Frankia]